MFSIRARAEKGIARHIDASSVVGTSNFFFFFSEHAHASYSGLVFHPPGFSPYMGWEERRVQGLDYSNGGPWNPKLTLETNSLRIKYKAQNFASWIFSEYALKIERKKGNDFLNIVPLEGFTRLMTSTVLICIFWPSAECRTFWLQLANFEAREKIRTR